MTSASQIMIVPVDVVAFCVGAGDIGGGNGADGGTNTFAGATTVYTDMSGSRSGLAAYLSANVSQSFDSAPWHPLEPGVHVHWALPDALTRATLPNTEAS